jgi:hypothetical protein
MWFVAAVPGGNQAYGTHIIPQGKIECKPAIALPQEITPKTNET